MSESFQFNQKSHAFSTKSLLIWLDNSHAPFLNMGIDEACFLESNSFEGPLLRFYDWDRPSISIGYFQKYREVQTKKFSIVRRPTGGGVVVHTNGITYSLVIPPRHWFYKIKRAESYGQIGKILMTALQDEGIPVHFAKNFSDKPPINSNTLCFETPVKYDVICSTNNKKIAGAAQKRNQKGLLHQGSILLHQSNWNKDRIIESISTQFKLYFSSTLKLFTPSHNLLNQAHFLTSKKYSEPIWNKKK